jgi:hypothetical protein
MSMLGTLRIRFASFFPESRALRILFYRPGTLPAFALFWIVTTIGFVLLMTYKSSHPLRGFDVGFAVVFGALIPLTLLLGSKRREIMAGCARPQGRDAAVAPSLLLSVVATFSCMCCLPVIPVILSSVLAGTAMASEVTPISIGIMSWSPVLFAASATLMLWSLHRNAKGLVLAADLS